MTNKNNTAFEGAFQGLLTLIDQEWNSKAWQNLEDCMLYCLIRSDAFSNGGVDGRKLSRILPVLRECYRLHRFVKYGHLEPTGEVSRDGLPVYRRRQWP